MRFALNEGEQLLGLIIMTTTTFTASFSVDADVYTLIVDNSVALTTSNWLTSKGCNYDRYMWHDGTCKFIFVTIPLLVVAQITAKYPLQFNHQARSNNEQLSTVVHQAIAPLTNGKIADCLSYLSIGDRPSTLDALACVLADYVWCNFPEDKLHFGIAEIQEAVRFALAD